jgi:hypothetical protein
MNKNNVIFILFVATLVGSTWGAVVNRQKIDLEHQLTDARNRLQKLSAHPGLGQAAGKGKNEGDLAALRKETQSLEAQLSESTAAIHALSREKEDLAQQLRAVRPSATAVQEKTASTAAPDAGGEETAGGEVLQQRLDEANAQLLGLEKIVEEKNTAMLEAAAEKERRQINMDVLLGKIADQQRALQALQEENRELVKHLAARKEMAEPPE